MRTIILSLIFMLIYDQSYGQCSCTDCPINILSNSTQSSFLDISGATNGTLGSNGQQLCQICIHFFHDAIQEVDFFLISPSGSSVQLIEDTGIAVNDNITFDICFVSCDQSASPDSGFPDVFDSDAGYVQGQTYDGSYYPSIGCLEDLTGDVNGEWELEMTDNIFLDDGELFDWYLVFADNSGTSCSGNGNCGSPPSCIAEGGELTDPDVLACEGSSELVVDFEPSFPNNNEAPAAEYDYTYVIINTDTDVIEEINTVTDLSSYPPGEYQICGLSYLIADEPLIPDPDGSYEINDLEDDIDDEVFCADLSDECVSITIEPMALPPDFDGPDEVCINEIYTYEILDYDPDFNYVINIVSGTIESLDGSDGEYEIEWLTGPGEVCAVIETACGDVETCIEVEVLGDPGEIEILGELLVCPGSEETYTVTPLPNPPELYDFTVTNGTILDQTDESVTIEWNNDEGLGEICAELIGGLCTVDPFCQEIEIEFDYDLPDDIDTPELVCLLTPVDATIPEDPAILDYIWTLNGLTLLDGQGTNTISYEAEFTGTGEICIEVITECSEYGPLCQDVEIIEYPDPMIIPVDPICEFEFTLEAIVEPGNDYDWTVITAPGDVEIFDDNQELTDVIVDATGIYTFQFSETNEANCEASDIINIEILNGPEISDLDYNCNLDMEYTVSFTVLSGNPPYTVNGEPISGSDFISEEIPSEETMEFEIIDDFGCLTIIEAEFECPCLSMAGTMQQALLHACAAENEPVQAIHNGDAFFDGNDIGIYILHDQDDNEIQNVLDFNNSGEFYYFQELEYGVIYYISYVVGDEIFNEVDLDDPCLSISIGQPVVFYDSPMVDFLLDSQTCDFELDVTGNIPDEIISLQWSQLSGPSTVMFSNAFSIPMQMSVSETGTYTILIEYENEACFDFQQVDFEIVTSPTITYIAEICGPSGEDYVITFDIVDGQAPFLASYPGNIIGTTFTSEPIVSGEEYQIQITDANGCVSNLLVGNKLCDCISSAGNMSPDPIEVCGTDTSVQAASLQNDSLDVNDTAFYFLHTLPFNTLGTVIDSNTTGHFEFLSSMQTDVIYYISYVVGDSIPSGINVLDPCLDVAAGQEVIWTSIPIVEAGMDQSTCADQVTLDGSPDDGFWSMISQVPGSETEIINSADPTSIFTFDLVGNYVLSYTSNNNNCAVSDTVVIIREESPVILDPNIKCSNDLLTFEYSFSIDGGSPPFTVNGQNSGNVFTADQLDAAVEHSFDIVNGEGCQTTVTVGPIICTCTSDAGTINMQTIELCDYENLDVNISNLDYILDENDTLFFLLHDGDLNTLGNILRSSTGEEILFDNDLVLNTTYILNVVVANAVNGQIDLNDPCIDISEGMQVTWIESHNIFIEEDFSLCEGAEFSVSLSTQGPLPVNLFFTNSDGDVLTFEINDFQESLDFTADIESTVWNLTEVTGQCIESFDGHVNIIVSNMLQVELNNNLEICNNALFGSVLALSQISNTPQVAGTWDTPGLNIISDSIDFDGLPAGEYPISFTTVGFEDPCPGNNYSTTITVIDCQCPTFEFETNIDVCELVNTIDLTLYNTSAYNGNWLLNNPNNLDNPPTINLNELELPGASEGDYELIFEITDPDYPENCQNIFMISLFIESQNLAGSQVVFPAFCESEESLLNLGDLLSNADNGGEWSYNNQPINPDIQIQDFTPGELEFIYTIPEGTYCPSDETTVSLQIFEDPAFIAEGENISCFGLEDGSIIIQPINGNGQPIQCFLNDILQEDGKEITDLSAGDYEIYLLNSDGCQSQTISITITEPLPVTVTLGDDQEVEINDIVTIRALVNIAESDIDNITWEDLNGIIADQNLSIDQQIINNNTISIRIIDENGCIAFDEINILVADIEIYIPNIFTPDSQDANDQFGPGQNPGVGLINEFIIYDRWGNMVFYIENINPDDPLSYWDGFIDGSPAMQGVYVYYLDIDLTDGSNIIIADDVTLIR